MHPLRDYQCKAVHDCFELFQRGARSVLLVSPTGSGKTRMGLEVVSYAARGGPVLWIAHRDTLVQQAANTLAQLGRPIGIIQAGVREDKQADIQVASIQTLVARGRKPSARVIVLDEAHHYAAADWGKLALTYQTQAVLGLTATPERSDGKPLGNLFRTMVLAANYPDLIERGHLVPCKVVNPDNVLDGLAQDPVATYIKYGEGQKGFFFTGSVELADMYAEQLRERGVEARSLHVRTGKDDRASILQDFRRGKVKVITNVYTMTEGVDVPDATVAVLARTIGHITPFLQICGRVLRPAEGKRYGIIIDLPGNTHVHGSPIEARVFTLEKGIQRKPGASPLRVCPNCGFTFPSKPQCPECGFRGERQRIKQPRIYSAELRTVFDGPGTPEWAKRRELERLMLERQARSWPIGVVVSIYRNLFGETPNLSMAIGPEDRRREYDRLAREARKRGYALGWAGHRFKHAFGMWPPRDWEARHGQKGA